MDNRIGASDAEFVISTKDVSASVQSRLALRKRSLGRLLKSVLIFAIAGWTASARADQLVVTRDVTARAAADRRSDVVNFPAVGSALEVLDAGQLVSGYYHVRLPGGRTAWVYRTFVRRESTATALVTTTNQMAVHYINVDQGAAALLEFPCGAVMIDAGGRSAAASMHLLSYINAFFDRRPDLHRQLAAVFVTHTHVDHNSNLAAVAGNFHVGSYIYNGVLTGSGKAAANWMVKYAPTANPPIAIDEVSEDQVVAAGAAGLTDNLIDPVNCGAVDPKIHVLSAHYKINPGWTAGDYNNQNDQSLVIRVDYGKASFLFTGDLEAPAIATLLQQHAGDSALDVDVYTVGHHGSNNGTTQALLNAMSPKIAVMSFGPPSIQEQWTAWAYGHPRRVTVSMLDEAVSMQRAPTDVLVADAVKTFTPYHLTHAVYGTGWDGDVTVAADANGALQVETGK